MFSTFNAIALALARVSTFCVDDETVNGPNVTDMELRHLEGQRYLVGLIDRRIQHANKVRT